MDTTTTDITITLKHIDDLFGEPTADPWDPSARYRSGIDEIFSKLRAIPIYEAIDIAIRLPHEEIYDGLEERIRAAIDRYCDARIEANADEIAGIKKEGRRDFLISIAVVITLLALVLILSYVLKPIDFLQTALVAWTGIAAWAILWNPVDTYVWGWRPNKRDIKYCQKIKSASLQIVAY